MALQISACDTANYRAASEEMVTIDLIASRRNAGETGKAFIFPRGDATQVRIDVSGSAVPVAAPVHLYMARIMANFANLCQTLVELGHGRRRSA